MLDIPPVASNHAKSQLHIWTAWSKHQNMWFIFILQLDGFLYIK